MQISGIYTGGKIEGESNYFNESYYAYSGVRCATGCKPLV